MATFGATFCLSKFITFLLFVVCILRFQTWFDVDVLDFLIELCCRYFGFFWLGQLFGLFFEKFGNFFQSSGHPVSEWASIGAGGRTVALGTLPLLPSTCCCFVAPRHSAERHSAECPQALFALLLSFAVLVLLCWIPVSTLPFWWMPWRLFLTPTLFLRRAVGWSNVVAPEFKAD